MSFDKAIEFAGWTLSFVAGQIRRRAFGSRPQPGPASAVSNLIESVEAENRSGPEITPPKHQSFFGLHLLPPATGAEHVQNSRATRDLLPLAQTGARKNADWTYSRKYLLSSKPGWTSQAVNTWENEGGSRLNRRRYNEEITQRGLDVQ